MLKLSQKIIVKSIHWNSFYTINSREICFWKDDLRAICNPWTLVAQSCPTLCDLMDWGPPCSSVHGILQAAGLDSHSLLPGITWLRDQTLVSCIAGRASLLAQKVKNPPAMQKTWVWNLGQEDPLEKGMATHSSILPWRIPWTKEPGGPQSMRVTKSQTWLSN